jgi:queuine/archaeosine tRNA-ribosyltransferase
VLKNKGLIAPISGGYDIELRERCARHMSSFPVLGFLLDGFFMNGVAALVLPHDTVIDIVSKTLVSTR